MAEALTPRLGRSLALLLATTVVVVGGAVSAVVGLSESRATTSSSRRAADRDCPAEPAPEPVPVLPGGPLSLVAVGLADEPTSLALRPGRHPDAIVEGVVGERAGRVIALVDGSVTEQVLLDLSADTLDDGDGGLLAVAYDPDGSWLYVYRADRSRDDVLTAYPLDAAGRPVATDERVVLRVDHPSSLQHHGGSLLFGPDGLLYIGMGDGGGLGDPREHAQDPSTLLGKVLRIAPTPDGRRPYAIPTDNPFADRYGWRPEIWALGVRNPFRMTLDGTTGDLWLGDVGQSCWEEIDRLPTRGRSAGGANLGWDRREAIAEFEGGDVPGGDVAPIHAYPHAEGWCAVVVGYVPRQSAVASLDGWLLHTDYCRGRLYALQRGASPDEPAVVRDLGLRVKAPIAVVPGPNGGPWVLTLEGLVLEVRARGGP